MCWCTPGNRTPKCDRVDCIPPQKERPGLREQLARTLNSVSAENGSDTPDFILARYLEGCLMAFDRATIERDAWYSRPTMHSRLGLAPAGQRTELMPEKPRNRPEPYDWQIEQDEVAARWLESQADHPSRHWPRGDGRRHFESCAIRDSEDGMCSCRGEDRGQ